VAAHRARNECHSVRALFAHAFFAHAFGCVVDLRSPQQVLMSSFNSHCCRYRATVSSHGWLACAVALSYVRTIGVYVSDNGEAMKRCIARSLELMCSSHNFVRHKQNIPRQIPAGGAVLVDMIGLLRRVPLIPSPVKACNWHLSTKNLQYSNLKGECTQTDYIWSQC